LGGCCCGAPNPPGATGGAVGWLEPKLVPPVFLNGCGGPDAEPKISRKERALNQKGAAVLLYVGVVRQYNQYNNTILHKV